MRKRRMTKWLQCQHGTVQCGLSGRVCVKMSALRLSSASDSWSFNHFFHLVHHIGLGLTDTHNLYHKFNLRWVGGGVGGTAGCSHTHCPTVNSTLPIMLTPPSLSPPNFPTLTNLSVTPHTPHLFQWHSVQFKLIAASMISTGDPRGRTLWIRFPLH